MGNITNISSKFDQQPYVSETAKTRGVDGRDGQPTEKTGDLTRSDKVSLSKESREIQTVQDAVAEVPDIRSDKIDPIKQRIAQGTYEVNAEKVAEGLIGEHISEVI